MTDSTIDSTTDAMTSQPVPVDEDSGSPRGGGDGPIRMPRLGPVGWMRWGWRNLTSMRTALFLLLLLSIAAVPGSVFPQRDIDPGKVADYLATNPTTGPWLDRFGFFAVYSSPWFSAIYLLLVISLIGCIVPRSRLHWHTLRSRPPKAPARLQRLESHATFTTDAAPGEVIAAAQKLLRSKRFRVHSYDDRSVSAESGHLRETGNLVFHIAICVIVVGVAYGHLFGWKGDVIVPDRSTFASTISAYDTFVPGPLVKDGSLPPFTLTVNKMDVEFETHAGGSQFGAPRKFEADTTVVAQPGAQPTHDVLSPNHPIAVGGANVYLLGNGYAPVVTVRDNTGRVLYQQATPFLAKDNNYTSVGAIKVPAAAPKQLGFSGYFLPTAEPSFADGPVSIFPDTTNPELALSVWEGDLAPGGRPQSVYTLTTTGMTEVNGTDGKPLLIRLKPGQSFQLPNDLGSISFDSVSRFAGLSVRSDPGQGLTLFAALATIAGLLASLLVRRRRVFVRVGPEGRGTGSADVAGTGTVVEIGALSRNADPTLARAIEGLRDELATRCGTPAPTRPSVDPGTPGRPHD